MSERRQFAGTTIGGGADWLERAWWDELSAAEVLDEGLTEDSVPAFERGQLFRSFAQFGKEGGDTGRLVMASR
jgi:hypothetical protein